MTRNLEHAADCTKWINEVLAHAPGMRASVVERRYPTLRIQVVAYDNTPWDAELDTNKTILIVLMSPDLRVLVLPLLQESKVKYNLRDGGAVLINLKENTHLQVQ